MSTEYLKNFGIFLETAGGWVLGSLTGNAENFRNARNFKGTIDGMQCPLCRQQNRADLLPKTLMSNHRSALASHMRQHAVRALCAAPPTNLMRSNIAPPGGFCRGVREGSGLASSTRAATTARPAPAKRDRSAYNTLITRPLTMSRLPAIFGAEQRSLRMIIPPATPTSNPS